MGRTLKQINARLTKPQTDRHRLSIQTAKLVRRLQDASAGLVDMTPVQLKATQILLDKSLPSLQAVQVAQHQETPSIGPHEAERLFQEHVASYIKGLPEEKRRELLESE